MNIKDRCEEGHIQMEENTKRPIKGKSRKEKESTIKIMFNKVDLREFHDIRK